METRHGSGDRADFGGDGRSLSRGPCAGQPGTEGGAPDGSQPARGCGWTAGHEGSHGRVPGLSLQRAGSRSRPCSSSTGTIRSRSGTSLRREQEQGRRRCPSRTPLAGCAAHRGLPVTPSQGRLLPPSTPRVDPSARSFASLPGRPPPPKTPV